MTETPTPYGFKPQSDFESQFRRVFEAASCRTQMELATFLEIRQSSISDAKRRRSIPSEWLIKLFDKKHTNPDWIRTGLGSMNAKIVYSEEGKTSSPMVSANSCPTTASSGALFLGLSIFAAIFIPLYIKFLN